MNISEICNKEVCTINKNESIKQAAKIMKEKNIGSLVILDDAKESQQCPVGILTDRDIAIKAVADKEQDLNDITISEIMCTDVLIIQDDQNLSEVINEMKKQKVRRAPVVSKDGKLCGIVSLDDLLIFMAQGLSELTDLIEGQVKAA